MPINWSNSGAPAPVAATPDEPSGLRRLLAGAVRTGAGWGASIPAMEPGFGSALGAGIAGAGEYAAEKIEGAPDVNMKRIGLEAALGAVPLSKVFTGRPLQSALRSAALAGVGEGGRELAEGQPLNTGRVAGTAGLGALLGGILGRYPAEKTPPAGPTSTPDEPPSTPGFNDIPGKARTGIAWEFPADSGLTPDNVSWRQGEAPAVEPSSPGTATPSSPTDTWSWYQDQKAQETAEQVRRGVQVEWTAPRASGTPPAQQPLAGSAVTPPPVAQQVAEAPPAPARAATPATPAAAPPAIGRRLITREEAAGISAPDAGDRVSGPSSGYPTDIWNAMLRRGASLDKINAGEAGLTGLDPAARAAKLDDLRKFFGLATPASDAVSSVSGAADRFAGIAPEQAAGAAPNIGRIVLPPDEAIGGGPAYTDDELEALSESEVGAHAPAQEPTAADLVEPTGSTLDELVAGYMKQGVPQITARQMASELQWNRLHPAAPSFSNAPRLVKVPTQAPAEEAPLSEPLDNPPAMAPRLDMNPGAGMEAPSEPLDPMDVLRKRTAQDQTAIQEKLRRKAEGKVPKVAEAPFAKLKALLSEQPQAPEGPLPAPRNEALYTKVQGLTPDKRDALNELARQYHFEQDPQIKNELGKALTNYTKQISNTAADTMAAAPAAPPNDDWIKAANQEAEQMAAARGKTGAKPGSTAGFADLETMATLGASGLGALLGGGIGGSIGAQSGHPVAGFVGGALAGAGLGALAPGAIHSALTAEGADPDKVAAALTDIGGSAAPAAPGGGPSLPPEEKVRGWAHTIFGSLPQIQRFSLLADARGLPPNVIASYGANIMAGLEMSLSGDPRGVKLLQAMTPQRYLQSFRAALPMADKAMTEAGERASTTDLGPMMPQAASRVFQGPAKYMTAGDIAARLISMSPEVGLSEDEARRITLNSEPWSNIGRNLTNMSRGSWLGQMLLPFARTPMNIAEQGVERIPGVGSLAQLFKKPGTADSFKRQMVQQGLGAGVGAAAGVLGSQLDPETAKVVRRYVTNLAGQYSLPANIGFAAGQALEQGKPVSDAIRRTGIEQGMPLPTTQTPVDWYNFATTGKVPRGVLPQDLWRLFFGSQSNGI